MGRGQEGLQHRGFEQHPQDAGEQISPQRGKLSPQHSPGTPTAPGPALYPVATALVIQASASSGLGGHS